jgi:ABC-type Fe3+ transport system substrate-binding protein
MVIVYNKKMVAADQVPQGWEDLLKPEWKGKISYTDPNKSGSSYTQMLTMYAAMGGWDFVQKFVNQLDGKAESSSTQVCKKVSDKELPIGITLEDNAYRYMVSGSKVDIVYPKEGTSAVPDGMALIKGAKNINAAKKFMDLSSGWNQIANPYSMPISLRNVKVKARNSTELVSLVDAVNRGWVRRSLFWWDPVTGPENGYSWSQDIETIRLEPWVSYWFKSNIACQLLLDPPTLGDWYGIGVQ